MKPLVVFIAAPFRGATAWQVAENVRAAERAALEVWRAGHVAVCPQANSALFHGAAPDEVFLIGYQELLRRCDVMYVAGATSAGVVDEMRVAAECGIPIVDSIESLNEIAAHGR